jgi:hypothetical protein
VVAAQFSVDAASTQVASPEVQESLGRIVPATIAALPDALPDGGKGGPYLVTWSDPMNQEARGIALFHELERAGFDVRATRDWAVAFTRRRVIDPAKASAQIHLAVGGRIEVWRKRKGMHEIVYDDPATRAERREFDLLRDLVAAELTKLGLAKRIPRLDTDPNSVGLDARFSRTMVDRVARMVEIGLPVAVFVGPPPG